MAAVDRVLPVRAGTRHEQHPIPEGAVSNLRFAIYDLRFAGTAAQPRPNHQSSIINQK
jgi:hypothetical protein